MQTGHYRTLTESMSNERRLRHDFRHHISVINECINSGERIKLKKYIEEIHSSILDSGVEYNYCGNVMVNAVIGYYLAKAKEVGADTNVNVYVPEEMNIKDTDLCIIFGNCLENAAEACSGQISDSKFINLSTTIQGSVFAIKIENSFDGQYSASGGKFLSAKREGYGIGLSSVSATAKKYNGSADFKASNGVFTAKIMLYF